MNCVPVDEWQRLHRGGFKLQRAKREIREIRGKLSFAKIDFPDTSKAMRGGRTFALRLRMCRYSSCSRGRWRVLTNCRC